MHTACTRGPFPYVRLGPMAVVRDLRVLLRLRDFRRLLALRLLSQGADGVYQVALATYVVFSPEKQTSAGAIASAMAVLLLPYSVVGPFAGVLLDRWRRRQVFLYGNLLRTVLASLTAILMLSDAPDWLFYASALCVTAVNRFILAGLSAAMPRLVDAERLVMANSVSPTAGTLAATLGADSRSPSVCSSRTPTPSWCSSGRPSTCARRSRPCPCPRNCSVRTRSWCVRACGRRSPARHRGSPRAYVIWPRAPRPPAPWPP